MGEVVAHGATEGAHDRIGLVRLEEPNLPPMQPRLRVPRFCGDQSLVPFVPRCRAAHWAPPDAGPRYASGAVEVRRDHHTPVAATSVEDSRR